MTINLEGETDAVRFFCAGKGEDDGDATASDVRFRGVAEALQAVEVINGDHFRAEFLIGIARALAAAR